LNKSSVIKKAKNKAERRNAPLVNLFNFGPLHEDKLYKDFISFKEKREETENLRFKECLKEAEKDQERVRYFIFMLINFAFLVTLSVFSSFVTSFPYGSWIEMFLLYLLQ
jgi:hypothetical protein